MKNRFNGRLNRNKVITFSKHRYWGRFCVKKGKNIEVKYNNFLIVLFHFRFLCLAHFFSCSYCRNLLLTRWYRCAVTYRCAGPLTSPLNHNSQERIFSTVMSRQSWSAALIRKPQDQTPLVFSSSRVRRHMSPTWSRTYADAERDKTINTQILTKTFTVRVEENNPDISHNLKIPLHILLNVLYWT